LLQGVVDVEDDALGAVVAVGGLVLALDDGVGDVVAPDAVEVWKKAASGSQQGILPSAPAPKPVAPRRRCSR